MFLGESLHANGDHVGLFRRRARHRRIRSAASVPVAFLLFGPLRNDQGEERHASALISPFLPPLRRLAQSQGTVPPDPFLFWCLFFFSCFRFLKCFHFETEASPASARRGLLPPVPIGGCGRCGRRRIFLVVCRSSVSEAKSHLLLRYFAL